MSQPNAELIRALEQFNRGEYWEQHETLEVLWRAERDESMRDLYKGILQVGVGFYHITRRNYAGAVKVLGRGIGYLRRYAPWCQGVDVAQLIEESTQVLERLHALGATRIAEIDVNQLPRVHYRVE
jgi:hypothetical protein